MSRSIAYCVLIVSAALVVVLAAAAPSVLSDEKNSFLKDFVNHEFLNVLGVILAITLASAGQIHLALNRIEERQQKIFLIKTRAGVRSAAYWLIGLFLLAVVLVVVKPLIAVQVWAQSLVNGAALVILLWTALILIALTQLVFAIKPLIEDES